MATAVEIAREYFPGADDAILDHIIWGRTGFPSFWRKTRDDETVEECFRRQLSEYKAAIARGTQLCDFCLNDAVVGEWLCTDCERALNSPASGIVTRQGGDAPAAPGAERLEPARTHASIVLTQGGSNDRG